MDCVAERIEDGRDFLVDSGMVPPDVGHGQGDVFGKCTGAVDADALGLGAEMAAACHAVSTASADDVALAADNVAGEEVVDVGADLDDFADELVADGHGDFDGFLGPVVPLEDVHVGAADAGVAHANQNVIDTDGRLWNVFQPKSFFCMALDQCFHELPPSHSWK